MSVPESAITVDRAVGRSAGTLDAVLCEGRRPADPGPRTARTGREWAQSVVWSCLPPTGIWLCGPVSASVHILGVPGWDQLWAVVRHPLLQSHLLFTCGPVCTPATTWPFHVPIHEPSQGCSTELLCPAGGSPRAGALPRPACLISCACADSGCARGWVQGFTRSLAPGLVSSCWPPACEHRVGLSLTSGQL